MMAMWKVQSDRKGGEIRNATLGTIMLMALLSLGPLTVDLTLPAYGLIVADLGGDAAAWQISFATFFLGFALGQFVFGLLADFIGRKSAVLSALALFSVASLLCANATVIEEFALYRFAQALGAGAGPLFARVMLRDRWPMRQAAYRYSTFGAVIEILPLVAPAAGAIIALSLGWRGLFIQHAILGIALALLVALRVQDVSTLQATFTRESVSIIRSIMAMVDARCLRDALSLSLVYAGLLVLITSSPTVFIGRFGTSPEIFSLLFAVIWLSVVMGMFCNRYLIQSFPLRGIVFCATTVASTGCGFVLMAALKGDISEKSFLVACIAYAFCSGFVTSNGLIQVMGEDHRYFAGRAALAGVVQYTVGAGMVLFSGVLGSSAEIVLFLLVGLPVVSLAIQFSSQVAFKRLW